MEDTEFSERLLTGGERLFYVPSAVVVHPVPPNRTKKGYFRSYYFAHGRSVARQAGHKLSIWRIPRYCVRVVRRKWRWISSMDMDRQWFLSAQGRFFCELQVLHALGQIVEGCHSYYSPGTATGSQAAGPLEKNSGPQ